MQVWANVIMREKLSFRLIQELYIHAGITLDTSGMLYYTIRMLDKERFTERSCYPYEWLVNVV